MNKALALSVGLARSWVALYTVRLPIDIREARRSEIDSDLWEQQWLALSRGDPATRTAIEVLVRTLLGISSDISWRAQARASAPPVRRTKVGQSWHANLTLLGGGALALLMIVIGLGALPAVAVISISVVLAVVGSRISFRRNAQGGGGHGTNVESTGRWKWLLLITALSLGAIVGMWLYAITLDHWGDTVTIMGFIALACLAVAVTAFSFLVADLTKGIARRANS